MGRTNPTYRDLLGTVEDRWAPYRRALRRDDTPHFDALFAHARAHADASGHQNHDDPMVAVLLSIALEQEKAIADLAERVEALEGADSTGTEPGGASAEGSP
ncbi:MAG: hypothetical protein ABEJ67_05270 [Halanaeroarchaeum sp.]